MTNIDFTVFESESVACLLGKSQVIAKCKFLQRASTGLRYYESLCGDLEDKNEYSEEMLVQFNISVYHNFLEDYIHIIKFHGHQCKQISNELINEYRHPVCDISKCKKTRRHYTERRTQTKSNNSNDNAMYQFYSEQYDQLHHFIFHLHRMGLRSDVDKSNIDDEEMDKSKGDDLFKMKLNSLRTQKDKSRLDISRYRQKNNKFIIQFQVDTNTVYDQSEQDASTFLEELQKHLRRDQNVTKSQLQRLMNYLKENEYDTDIVKDDIQHAFNVHNMIKNSMLITSIRTFIRNDKLASSSFSTGFIFFYWDHFRNETEPHVGDWLNGYSMSQLYIKRYYQSLKEEIMSSYFLNIAEWNKHIVIKGQWFFNTEKVKNMKCHGEYTHVHGILFEQPISISHLYAIILYCDWTELCSHFSSTFRKQNQFEPVKLLKYRNSKYWNLSKLLVEAVNDFGINGYGEWDGVDQINRWDASKYINKEYGPFYCGMSSVMNISSFAAYLKGPCSTSKYIEIAINFATRDGIIMQLQNTGYEAEDQRFFDCSWISRYGEENERLFVAAEFRLQIESVIIIETTQNFENYFHTFYLFDCMLSGHCGIEISGGDVFEISTSDINILESLISSKVNQTECSMDNYIIDVFDSFVNKKTHIKIHMHDLHKFQKMKDFIMHSVVENDQRYE
eukprot:355709_1